MSFLTGGEYVAHKALLVSTSTEAKKDDIPCAAQSIQTVVVASPAQGEN